MKKKKKSYHKSISRIPQTSLDLFKFDRRVISEGISYTSIGFLAVFSSGIFSPENKGFWKQNCSIQTRIRMAAEGRTQSCQKYSKPPLTKSKFIARYVPRELFFLMEAASLASRHSSCKKLLVFHVLFKTSIRSLLTGGYDDPIQGYNTYGQTNAHAHLPRGFLRSISLVIIVCNIDKKKKKWLIMLHVG